MYTYVWKVIWMMMHCLYMDLWIFCGSIPCLNQQNPPASQALSSITLSCPGSEDFLILGATLHRPMYLASGKSSLGILGFRDLCGVCVSQGNQLPACVFSFKSYDNINQNKKKSVASFGEAPLFKSLMTVSWDGSCHACAASRADSIRWDIWSSTSQLEDF